MTSWKEAVRAATTGSNITLSGLQTIDGVDLASLDRVLVKDQTTGAGNGIYTASADGWTRSSDASTSELMTPETAVRVSEGETNAHTVWALSTYAPITLDVTTLAFQLAAERTYRAGTIRGMQSLAGPFMTGELTIVAGYATPGDGGGGQFSFEGSPPPSATIAGASALPTAQIIGATNASPIVITTLAPHGFTSGQSVFVDGVLGNTAANGTRIIDVINSTQFSLRRSIGSGEWTGGGTQTASSVVVTTAGAHGLARSQQVMIAGVEWSEGTGINGTWPTVGVPCASITNATSSAPIEIITSTQHGFVSGESVLISDVLGNVAANGLWLIDVTSPTTFRLRGSDGRHSSYTSGGAATSLSASTFSIGATTAGGWSNGGLVGDGGHSIPSNAFAGRWLRVRPSNVFDVKAFGADASTTYLNGQIEHQGADCLAVFNTAIAAMGHLDESGGLTGQVLFVPEGGYFLSDNLIISKGLILRGETGIAQASATRLIFAPGKGVIVDSGTDGGYHTGYRAVIEHLGICCRKVPGVTGRLNRHPYSVGDRVISIRENGADYRWIYRCISAGTSADSEPDMTNYGKGLENPPPDDQIIDDGVTWQREIASGIYCRTVCHVHNVSIMFASCAGIHVQASVAHTPPTGANGVYLGPQIRISGCGGGVFVGGSDAQPVTITDVDYQAADSPDQLPHVGQSVSSIKNSTVTSPSPVTYTGAALDGVIGTATMEPPQRISVTSAPSARSYALANPIMITGKDVTGKAMIDNLLLTLVDGGETVSASRAFASVESIAVPAMNDASGSLSFGSLGAYGEFGVWTYAGIGPTNIIGTQVATPGRPWILGRPAGTFGAMINSYDEGGGYPSIINAPFTAGPGNTHSTGFTPEGHSSGTILDANGCMYLKVVSHRGSRPTARLNLQDGQGLYGFQVSAEEHSNYFPRWNYEAILPGWWHLSQGPFQSCLGFSATPAREYAGNWHDWRGHYCAGASGFDAGFWWGVGTNDNLALTDAWVRQGHYMAGDKVTVRGSGAAGTWDTYVVSAAGFRGRPWVARRGAQPAQPSLGTPATIVEPSANGTPIPTPGSKAFYCIAVAGDTTTGNCEPNWAQAPNLGDTIVDNNVTWVNAGPVPQYVRCDFLDDPAVKLTVQNETDWWDGPQGGSQQPRVRTKKASLITRDGTTAVLHAYPLPDNAATVVYADVLAKQTSGTASPDGAEFALKGVWYRDNGGAPVQVKAPTVTDSNPNANGGPWAAVLVLSENEVKVMVAGAAGKTIHWSCVRQGQEAS